MQRGKSLITEATGKTVACLLISFRIAEDYRPKRSRSDGPKWVIEKFNQLTGALFDLGVIRSDFVLGREIWQVGEGRADRMRSEKKVLGGGQRLR